MQYELVMNLGGRWHRITTSSDYGLLARRADRYEALGYAVLVDPVR